MTRFGNSKDGLKRTGEKVQYLRKLRRYSQEELAKRMGYSNRSSIARIENGTTDIPVKQILNLATILGCEPAYLVGTPEEIARIDPENDYVRDNDLREAVMDEATYYKEYTLRREFNDLYNKLTVDQIEVVMSMMKALGDKNEA